MSEKIEVTAYDFKSFGELNGKVAETFAIFKTDFQAVLKTQKPKFVKLAVRNGKSQEIEKIVIASQIFNCDLKEIGEERQICVVPTKKQTDGQKIENEKIVLSKSKCEFTYFSIEIYNPETHEIKLVDLPSKLKRRFVGKSTDKTQAEPAADKSSVEPASSDKLEASDDLLFELSDLIVARFKIDNKNRPTIESAMASILERYSIQKK